jgi:hypothetical protein
MAFAENQAEGGSSIFADDGTASHHWSGLCLQQGLDAEFFLEAELQYNDAVYTMDETRASFCQAYIDDVRRRAIGGSLYVEYGIDLSEHLGEGQGGTADVLIYLPETMHLICDDLKYGTGEKVFAKSGDNINPQLGLYLLGALKDMELLGNKVEKVTGVICQPRLNHIDEHTITVVELLDFGRKAALAVEHAGKAMIKPNPTFLSPGEKQCRWCRAKAVCPALARFVADEVRCEFETIEAGAIPVTPADTTRLSKAKLAVPLIRDWCNAVDAEVSRLVTAGEKVIGPDGLPYKFVQGDEGKRAWSDEVAAEAALLGQLPPEKTYAPRKIITAPQAGKLLDKKKTAQLWEDIFKPLIKRASGKAMLAIGSDSRPPFTGAASLEEFEEDLTA